MAVFAFILVKFSAKSKNNNANIKILASLHLTGRDIFYVIKCGSEVIAFVSGSAGFCNLGKWNYEDWLKNCDTLNN